MSQLPLTRRLAERSASALRQAYPLAATVGQAVLWFAVMVALAEGLARSQALRPMIGYPSIHSPNPYFNAQIGQLEQAAEGGSLECIVLGSSQVYTALQPDAFSDAYQQATGGSLECHNAGVPGLTTQYAGTIARVLINTFHPRILIFGTSARDYNDRITALNWGQANDIVDTPWIRYRLGMRGSWEGWLIDHSLAYRHSLDFRAWMQSAAPTRPAEAAETPPDLTRPPDPNAEPLSFELFNDFTVSAAGLAGLDEVLAVQAQGITVYVVEMPVHPTYLYYFPNGEADQAYFRQEVADLVTLRGSQFWPADSTLSIVNAGWHDRNHLNTDGGRVFSAWLARHVAAAQGSPR